MRLLLLLLALLCVLPIVFCNDNAVTDVVEPASAEESSLNSTETTIEHNSTDTNATDNVDDNLDILQLLLDKMEAGIDTSDELSVLEDLDEDQREAMFKRHEERMAVLKANLLAEEGVRLDQSPVESSPLEQAANGEDDGDDEEVDADTIQHLVASLAAVQSKLAAVSANESNAQPDVGVDLDSNSDADDGEEEDISSDNIDELLKSLRDLGMPLPDDQEQNLRSALSNKAEADQEKKSAEPSAPKVHDEL